MFFTSFVLLISDHNAALVWFRLTWINLASLFPLSNCCSRVLRKDNPALQLRDLDQPERENLDHDLEVRFSHA